MVTGGTTVVRARGLAKTYVRGTGAALREVPRAAPGELSRCSARRIGQSTCSTCCRLGATDAARWTGPRRWPDLADRLPWGRLAIVPQALGLLEDLWWRRTSCSRPADRRLKELRPRAEELMTRSESPTSPPATAADLAREQQRCARPGRCCWSRRCCWPTSPRPPGRGWTDAIFTSSAAAAARRRLLSHPNPETWATRTGSSPCTTASVRGPADRPLTPSGSLG